MIINLKSQTDLSGFYIVYNGSTLLECKGLYGISHMSEHLVCKSIEPYEDELQRDGISWNAYTDTNQIVFYLTGLDKEVNKWKHIFLSKITEFKPTEEQLTHEKNIVLQEYTDCFNDQMSSHILNLLRKYYNSFDAIGLREDIQMVNYEHFMEFYNLQYYKPSMIINISAKNDLKENITFDNTNYSAKLLRGTYNVPFELSNTFEDKTSIVLVSDVLTKDFSYIKFINTMLSNGLNSPLYKEIREKKGLVYRIGMGLERKGNTAVSYLATITTNKNKSEVIDTIKEVLQHPEKYITVERFENIKKYYIVRMLKEEILRYTCVNKYLDSNEFNIENILDTITFDKCMEVYNEYYDINKLYISDDKSEFPK